MIKINQYKYSWNSEATVISDCPTRKKMIVPETLWGAVVFHGRARKTESESLAPPWISTASSTQGCQGHSLHSARSIPPPVDIMCVRIYTVCEYLLCANIYWLQISTGRGPSVLISLKSCHPLSESLILHFKHKRSRDTRDHPTTRGLYFFSVRKLIFQDYSTL